MVKRAARSTRAAVLSDAHEEDVKPDIQELSARNFLPFSRTHRAELNEIVGQTALKPSVSFCSNWATAHNVDPALVDDWAQRRTGGGKKNTARGKGKDTLRTSGARCESDADDIRVKRERAASPVLAAPPKKRARTGRSPRGAASATVGKSSTSVTSSTSASSSTAAKSSSAAKSTTAANSSMTNKSPTVTGTHKPVRHTRAHDAHPHPACPTCLQNALASSLTTSAAGLSALSAVSTPSGRLPTLKSALRNSALAASVTRLHRQVRFSADLLDGIDDAYTHPQAPPQPQDGAYTQPARHSGAPDPSPSMPPRFKRKLMMSSTAPVNVLPALVGETAQVATFELSPTDPDSWPTIPTSDVRSGASDDTPVQDASVQFTTESMLPKRRKLSRPEPAMPTLPLPLPVAPAPDLPPPRTPSPQVQVKIESSFFSPSFFSSPARSSSPSAHSHDERMLPSSSPPTSPFPVSSPKMTAPVPLRPFAKRLSSTVPDAHSMPPSPMQPPQDIPRPSRTPPCPDRPGSRPNSPDPRPHRPADDVLVDDAPQDPSRSPPLADIPPRARTPPYPDGPESGSRPGTPQPRPVRPEHGENAIDESTTRSEPDGLAVAQSAVEVKREQIELATAQLARSTFVLDDDEDDEPLMVVVARKRQARSEKSTAQKAQAEKPTTRARRGAKAKKVEQARVTTVKTEGAEAALPSVPPRHPTKRGYKKSAAIATAEIVKVEPAADAAEIVPAEEYTAAPSKPKKSPRKKAVVDDATPDVLVPVISWGAPDPEIVETTKAQGKSKAPTKKTAMKKKTKKENKETAPPTRSESQDIKTWRPPHTLVHAPAYLELVSGEGVKWDEKGFGCMELSALPWIAGVGYRAVEVPFGERDVLFDPAVPRVVEEREKEELPAVLVPEVVEGKA